MLETISWMLVSALYTAMGSVVFGALLLEAEWEGWTNRSLARILIQSLFWPVTIAVIGFKEKYGRKNT